jgi:hypothetical protein
MKEIGGIQLPDSVLRFVPEDGTGQGAAVTEVPPRRKVKLAPGSDEEHDV